METVSYWVGHYGYPGIFILLLLGIFGLPVPDEWLLAFAGYSIGRHTLHPVPTITAAFFGSASGITISYCLGRSVGLFILHRYGRLVHMTSDRIQRVHDWYERFGSWTLFFGFYVPGVRHLSAIVAGTSQLEWLPFLLFAYSGALVWSCTFIAIGYLLGERWAHALKDIHHHLLVATLIASLLMLAVYCVTKYRRNQTIK